MWSLLTAGSVSRRVSVIFTANTGNANSAAISTAKRLMVRPSEWIMGREFNERVRDAQNLSGDTPGDRLCPQRGRLSAADGVAHSTRLAGSPRHCRGGRARAYGESRSVRLSGRAVARAQIEDAAGR